ncbi:MAG: hypothetical protein KA795_18975, partial [Burkholderiaceae bacterium]|nr:hypothetical protein [Burkholderiaceae bacterium]
MSGVPPPLAATPPREAIESLCERLGIAARWHDFYGALRDVPDAVLLAALDAVGHPARNADELARSQAALQAGAAPAAQILREGEPLRIAIGAHGPAPLAIVQCEDGSVLRARLDDADGARVLLFDG